MTDNPLLFTLAVVIAAAWVAFYVLRPFLLRGRSRGKGGNGVGTPVAGGDSDNRRSDEGGWLGGLFSGEGDGGGDGGGG